MAMEGPRKVTQSPVTTGSSTFAMKVCLIAYQLNLLIGIKVCFQHVLEIDKLLGIHFFLARQFITDNEVPGARVLIFLLLNMSFYILIVLFIDVL